MSDDLQDVTRVLGTVIGGLRRKPNSIVNSKTTIYTCHKIKDKMNRLYFHVDTTKKGFCVMALDDEKTSGSDSGSNSDSEASRATNELVTGLNTMNKTFLSQDKLLRHAVKEWNKFKAKLEQALKDVEFARAPVVSEETKCDRCVVHMSNLATLQTKYAYLFDDIDEASEV